MNLRSSVILPIASLVLIAFTACAPNASYIVLITATPSGPEPGTGGGQPDIPAQLPTLNPTTAPTPTFIPTPNPTRTAIIDPNEDQIHVVQFGDTLSTIAEAYGVSVDALIQANNLADANVLAVGQTLVIPLSVQTIGPDFKIIPDSELVYGPALQDFSVEEFLEGRNSFLSTYTEELNGHLWTGPQIVERVALEQSLNPRLLLALLEYESRWISQPMVSEDAMLYPMNYTERPTQVYGLYRQLDWAGKMLQLGYYGWRLRGLSAALLSDGMRVGLNPTINAGTAGVQMLLAQTRTLDEWLAATHHTGFFLTYVSLFGDPFQYAVDPLIPPDLTQPPLTLPWGEGETWYFTGGPHGGWGSASAWAALDFVPVEEVNGCEIPDDWVTAVADGVIARSEYGIVVLDLDGDGFEGTGWTIFYLHISSEERPVVAGQRVRAGDPIGHPSCEGGVSWSTHVHIARRYNGEWITADCSDCLATVTHPQFNLDGWLAYSFGREYDGSLIRGDEYREACTCRAPLNTITR
ncbi:MAG TPA: LysM peptidoglycan-binding domain-containing protein [Chloroflexi bacterium]|nr:LysM peptidoglycan-binding domain-containing protein [Chloroflexota bacterium]